MGQAEELLNFVASSLVFRDVPRERLGELVPLLQVQEYPAGTVILRQGDYSANVYFLLAGRVAVRIRRGGESETVAWIQPPDLFGELSVVTGRPCVADVEVVVDARVALLSKDAFEDDPAMRNAIIRGLTRIIAERLRVTVEEGTKAAPAPVLLLRPDPTWDAPRSFPSELAKALQRETGKATLLVEIGPEPDQPVQPLGNAGICRLSASSADLRSIVASRIGEWSSQFTNLIFSPYGPQSAKAAEPLAEFANWYGLLLGPGSRAPAEEADLQTFVLQNGTTPTLPVQNGRQQLIFEAAESEDAFRNDRLVTKKFLRTVDSIARLIAGTQVGLALGGGAAWGWAHIGVLEALENAGIPVDMISGCSMGSVIGSFRAAGLSIKDLYDIADFWRNRTRRFIEWRIWKFCLISEKMVEKVFHGYFGDRNINQTEIPFWANAVDIQAGHEYTLKDRPLKECVRCSIALPGLIPPFRLGEYLLVDAGILDPVPVRVVRTMGAHFVIAVNAMVPPGAQKLTARYPLNLFEILNRCMFVMAHEIGQAAAEKSADILFTPELAHVSMLQFGRSSEIIASGREAAEKRLPAIRAMYDRRRNQAPLPMSRTTQS